MILASQYPPCLVTEEATCSCTWRSQAWPGEEKTGEARRCKDHYRWGDLLSDTSSEVPNVMLGYVSHHFSSLLINTHSCWCSVRRLRLHTRAMKTLLKQTGTRRCLSSRSTGWVDCWCVLMLAVLNDLRCSEHRYASLYLYSRTNLIPKDRLRMSMPGGISNGSAIDMVYAWRGPQIMVTNYFTSCTHMTTALNSYSGNFVKLHHRNSLKYSAGLPGTRWWGTGKKSSSLMSTSLSFEHELHSVIYVKFHCSVLISFSLIISPFTHQRLEGTLDSIAFFLRPLHARLISFICRTNMDGRHQQSPSLWPDNILSQPDYIHRNVKIQSILFIKAFNFL